MRLCAPRSTPKVGYESVLNAPFAFHLWIPPCLSATFLRSFLMHVFCPPGSIHTGGGFTGLCLKRRAVRPGAFLGRDPKHHRAARCAYDLLGRRIRTVVDTNAEGRTEAQLDVSGLAGGAYFLRMHTDAGPVDTQRVTVVR